MYAPSLHTYVHTFMHTQEAWSELASDFYVKYEKQIALLMPTNPYTNFAEGGEQALIKFCRQMSDFDRYVCAGVCMSKHV